MRAHAGVGSKKTSGGEREEEREIRKRGETKGGNKPKETKRNEA